MRQKFIVVAFLGLLFFPRAAAGQGQTPSPPEEFTLPQAVELALKNNPALQAADSYAEAVRHAVASAKAGYYPRVDFSEGFTRSNNPVFVFSSLLTQRRFAAQDIALGSLNFPLPLDNFRTQFTAGVPLYDAGQTARRVHDARFNSQEAEESVKRTRQEVIYQVIISYLNQILAGESVSVAEESVKSTEEDLARARARQEQGQALLSDVLSAEVQLAQAKAELIRARNGAAMAQSTLAVAMGLAEDTPVQARGHLNEVTFESGTLAEQQQRALALRPDYQQALLGKDKAANATAGARAQFLPTVNLFSSWEQDNESFAARGGNNWTAGATLNFTLFDGGARRAQLAESHARERQAEALRAQIAEDIRLQVHKAYLNLTGALDRVDVSRQSASQAQESLSILRNRYEAGLATITDVLNAETTHARAQRDFLGAVYDYRIAYATLELSTGELAPGSQAVVR
ncbi:MAG TPA: TolC family protein [Terriglobia bacterium]|nr:TolC family protein [Terriglobia bacterium]